MDTKSLISFMRAYEQGNIAKAAKELFITPQGLSKSIARLESELGAELFERNNRGIVPTRYARALYPRAARIAALLDEVEALGRDGLPRGVLNVSSTSGYLLHARSDFERDFAAAHPEIDLRVTEGDDQRAAQMVAEGTVECGFVAGPVDFARFDAHLLSRHPHVCIASLDDPLARKEALELADLEGYRVAVMGQGFSPYNYIQERFARERVHPAEVLGVAEIVTAFRLIRPGDLVAITVRFAHTQNPWPGLQAIPFTDPEFSWDAYLITSRGAALSAEASAFRDFVIAWFADHAQEQFD